METPEQKAALDKIRAEISTDPRVDHYEFDGVYHIAHLSPGWIYPSDEKLFTEAWGDSPAELLYALKRIKRSLAPVHTRQLLDYLKHARACGGWYSPWDGSTGYTIEELKAELETREHVPNKAEAKRIRQDKAKRRP